MIPGCLPRLARLCPTPRTAPDFPAKRKRDSLKPPMDACRETFPLLGNDTMRNRDLRMTVEDFPDRVQVTIEHSGDANPTAGLDSFVGGSKEGVAAGISHSLAGHARRSGTVRHARRPFPHDANQVSGRK